MYADKDQIVEEFDRLRELPENKHKIDHTKTLLGAENVVLFEIWSDQLRLKKATGK